MNKSINIYSPNYSYVFDFESNFDYRKGAQWMENNWTLSIYYSIIYLSVVFGGKKFMVNRSAYKLKVALIIWNLLLASFSIMGTLRTLPEMIHVIKTFGFNHSVCSSSYVFDVNVTSLWAGLFVMSKVPELGDTLFIVARKQPLIFLHWYHHITVLVFSWHICATTASLGRWFMAMNFMVHSLMYSYFAVRAMGYRVPKSIAMCITLSQIYQMVFGLFVTLYALYKKSNGNSCESRYFTIYFGLVIYVSYFLLFVHFFLKSYSPKNITKSNKAD